MNNSPHKKHRLRGQALVEFALVLPLLLVLILGAMDLGRMFYAKIVITNAAREGAYYMAYNYHKDIRNKVDPEVNSKEAVRNEANSSLVDYNALDIDFLDDQMPENMAVKVSTTVDLVYGNFLQSLGIVSGPMTLSSTVRMEVH